MTHLISNLYRAAQELAAPGRPAHWNYSKGLSKLDSALADVEVGFAPKLEEMLDELDALAEMRVEWLNETRKRRGDETGQSQVGGS